MSFARSTMLRISMAVLWKEALSKGTVHIRMCMLLCVRSVYCGVAGNIENDGVYAGIGTCQ